ncbi:MAG: haloacid dehalogenase [Rhodomicrobium sp.]|nr:MAG: haloacid dehalogenase [Rhodomicrobium sp.]
MHNGLDAFEEAIVTCRRFQHEGGSRGTGGQVILITNAPRPAFSVAEQLEEFGVPDDCYDAIVSSGDVSLHLLSQFEGRGIHHIGPLRDKPMVEAAKLKPVPFDDAEVLFLTGLLDDETEGPEDYRTFLMKAVERSLPMICANPDLMVERGARLVYCAGAVAELYKQLGGEVLYAGKPYAPIYELAMARLNDLRECRELAPLDRSAVLCIGDGVKTDMPGAFKAGFDALFIASGLHVGADLDASKLEELFAGADGQPVAAMQALRW